MDDDILLPFDLPAEEVTYGGGLGVGPSSPMYRMPVSFRDRSQASIEPDA